MINQKTGRNRRSYVVTACGDDPSFAAEIWTEYPQYGHVENNCCGCQKKNWAESVDCAVSFSFHYAGRL